MTLLSLSKISNYVKAFLRHHEDGERAELTVSIPTDN